MVFINECKSCEISNQLFYHLLFSFSKRRTGYDYKIKLFSGAISHGVSNEPDAYLQPSQTSTSERFCENVNGYKPLTIFAKNLHRRYSAWF